jgi:glycosyltransferase involved in cell wall biosynthesis
MKILFVHNELATFVKIDLDILRSAHEVRELHVRRTSAAHLARAHASLARDVAWADLVFAWFGGYHALLPFSLAKAQGRKCIVVASGYDVAAEPQIDYGNMRPGVRRVIGRRVFAMADKVLAVSHFAGQEALRNARVPAHKIAVIPHGLDAGRFRPGSQALRNSQVLTVASLKPDTVVRKGLREYAAVAARLPNTPFLIAGPQDPSVVAALRRTAPSNLHLLGPIYGDGLVDLMQASAVYAQFSAYESFGMALAEAMLCGCVGVVTDCASLPEVVGGTGTIVPYADLDAYAAAVQGALAAPPAAGEAARQRILHSFPIERRRKALLLAIEEVHAHAPAAG